MDGSSRHERDRRPAEAGANPVLLGVERAIHEQRLPPGTRLAESELSEIYGVSRTIVRSALQALAHSQLVTIKPNSGARVARPSPEEAREVFEARELIEARVAREAARKAEAADIARLRAHCDTEHEALAAGEHGRALQLSGAFHLEVARISGHGTLASFVEQLVARSALIIALYSRRERVRCDNRSHKRLIDAIAAGDADEAEALMRSHLVDIHGCLAFDGEDRQLALREMLLSPD